MATQARRLAERIIGKSATRAMLARLSGRAPPGEERREDGVNGNHDLERNPPRQGPQGPGGTGRRVDGEEVFGQTAA